MPYEYEVDSRQRLVYVRGWGPMDLEETLRAPERLAEHPDFRPDFGIVVDLRDLDYAPRAADVIAVARNMVRLRGLFKHRIAIIVPAPLHLAAELGAAIAAAGGFPELRIFDSPDQAQGWVLAGAGSSPA